MVEDASLSIGARATFALLTCIAGNDDIASVSPSTIATRLGAHRASIYRWLAELEVAGLLDRLHRPGQAARWHIHRAGLAGRAADGQHSATRPHRDGAGRGCRLPADWTPTPKDRAFAEELGLDPDAVAAEFLDYWCAVPNARGRKLDWSMTWRNRCRTLAQRRGARRAGPRPGPAGTHQRLLAGFARAIGIDDDGSSP